MKRRASVSVKDGDVKVKVEISVQTNGGCLTRDEVNTLVEQLTGRIVEALPGLRYTHFPRVRIKARL